MARKTGKICFGCGDEQKKGIFGGKKLTLYFCKPHIVSAKEFSFAWNV